MPTSQKKQDARALKVLQEEFEAGGGTGRATPADALILRLAGVRTARRLKDEASEDRAMLETICLTSPTITATLTVDDLRRLPLPVLARLAAEAERALDALVQARRAGLKANPAPVSGYAIALAKKQLRKDRDR